MRLFYGISLPGHVCEAVSICASACQTLIPGRYTRKENYYITLAFLGNVPQDRTADAGHVLRRCIENRIAPLLTLGETSYFGRAQNAILISRVLSSPSLDSLHHALLHSLGEADLPFDSGPFSPHITLARHARIEETPLPSCTSISFVPGCAHLYLSARNDQNVLTYTPIYSVSFSHSHVYAGK